MTPLLMELWWFAVFTILSCAAMRSFFVSFGCPCTCSGSVDAGWADQPAH